MAAAGASLQALSNISGWLTYNSASSTMDEKMVLAYGLLAPTSSKA
jgi:hypothetical protein